MKGEMLDNYLDRWFIECWSQEMYTISYYPIKGMVSIINGLQNFCLLTAISNDAHNSIILHPFLFEFIVYDSVILWYLGLAVEPDTGKMAQTLRIPYYKGYSHFKIWNLFFW